MKIRFSQTFLLDEDELFSYVDLKVSRKEALKFVRKECIFLVREWCARVMDCPNLNEKYLAQFLCDEGLANRRENLHPDDYGAF